MKKSVSSEEKRNKPDNFSEEICGEPIKRISTLDVQRIRFGLEQRRVRNSKPERMKRKK